jgi:hypothetical protein
LAVFKTTGECKLFSQQAASFLIPDLMSTVWTKKGAYTGLAGLVNYWPFNGDYKDYVGGADLSPTGVTSFIADRSMFANQAVNLNGAYLVMPSRSYVSGTTFSLMGWIYVYNYVWVNVFVLGNGAPSDNVNYGTLNGKLSASLNGQIVSSSVGITLNTWVHTALTYDGVNMKCFINGTLLGSGPISYVLQNVPRSMSTIGVDAWIPQGNTGFIVYDDLRIYNRIVSASELQLIMSLW